MKAMKPIGNADAPAKSVRAKVFLIGRCSSLTVGSVVDTLNEVNRQTRQTIFEIQVIDVPVTSSLRSPGIPNFPADRAEWIIVSGDEPGQIENASAFFDMLKVVSNKAQLLLGVNRGVWWLAQAGLLDGYSASVSTGFYDEFSQKFVNVRFNQRMFDLDGTRATSAGGFATVDLLLTLIARQNGATVGELVRNALHYPQIRSKQKLQHNTDLSPEARADARLMEALHIMETNLSDPLQTGEIARLASLSKRQLERLFGMHLKTSPSAYYLDLRLQQARAQLGLTTKSASQIGIECGFSSPAYFSFAYRRKFGVSPGEQRELNDN